MPRSDASDLACRLGQNAEATCRHYLSNGRRQGNYWLVGDVRNTPGRSMFVRLRDSRKGRAGKWLDAATGEHGDLLDVIREVCGLTEFCDVAEEARRFLGLPQVAQFKLAPRGDKARSGSTEAARRLWAMSQPIAGTTAENYLRQRRIAVFRDLANLRFHPHCFYRPDDHGPTQTWPAMIAAVTDLAGAVTGAQRTWLSPDGSGKAPIDTQRKAMGDLLGHAVRFGRPSEIMAVGEGVETILSLKSALPHMPMAAALSAAHLAAILFPPSLRRLYIACDKDPAGDWARDQLTQRANEAGIEAVALTPMLGDFNDDLVGFGIATLRAHVRVQVTPEDVARFMSLAA
ncbi:toprim domain-containing protein [Rhodoblastus sp.]|jgi:hypothetical protein|uniref:DUF7146 domain-containing protein n=1 Tax=Rhodoblastus sp. TaxID=1962975 RepID=UPI0025D7E11F|nr:toprim domain-containing protein [Rhodoblastus sp.]